MLLFSFLLTWEHPLWWTGFFILQGGDGSNWASLRSDKPGWRECSEGLTWGDHVIYPLHFWAWRDAFDNFAESTGVNWVFLGQTRPYGHPSWGQCEQAQEIEESFIKYGEDAKEYRSSFKHFQAKCKRIDFFLWKLLSVGSVVFAGEKMWCSRKGRGYSRRQTFLYSLLSVWLLGMLPH